MIKSSFLLKRHLRLSNVWRSSISFERTRPGVFKKITPGAHFTLVGSPSFENYHDFKIQLNYPHRSSSGSLHSFYPISESRNRLDILALIGRSLKWFKCTSRIDCDQQLTLTHKRKWEQHGHNHKQNIRRTNPLNYLSHAVFGGNTLDISIGMCINIRKTTFSGVYAALCLWSCLYLCAYEIWP